MKTVSYWLEEIKAAKKREKDYRKDGERILEICEGEKKAQTPFNILFSNTETLHPALYSATPRPVVARRFKDEDPTGKAAAVAGERVLSFLLDTNIDGYETFDEAMGAATYDALLPGRGVTTVKYDAETGELPAEEGEATPYMKSELVCVESTNWKRVYFGYAKKWSKVPWICYEFDVDQEEAVRLVGDIANKLTYTTPEKEDAEEGQKEEDDQGERRVATLYQIWDKDVRKIVYVAPQYRDGILATEDDPLGLTGFFNCPRPIQFIERSSNLVPVAPYLLYENQAEELNKLTGRIKHVTAAIRARGVYDGELGTTLSTLMESDDNTLIPVDKSASLAAEGGMDRAIWFMPVEKLIVVLRELYAARESCKQVIFEIMGLADIMRGASQASETLGAQQMKQSWGSLKLKRKQKEVQRYARDLLRMQLEIAAKKFSEETWAKMTGLPYLTEAKVMELQKVLLGAQAQMQIGSPQAQQQLQQAQQQLQMPKWSDVLATLQNDLQRAYRIDIETNSTVEPEAVEDQKNIAEVMSALGQFLNGVSPLVANGTMPFQAAQSMMLAIVRRFRFGDEIEDYIKQMKAPQPPQDGKAQAEQQKMQMEQKRAEQDMQFRQQEAQQKHQLATQSEQASVQAEVAKLQMMKAIEDAKLQAQREAEAAKLMQEKAIAQMEAQMQQTTEIKKAAITAAAQIEIARMNAAVTAQGQEHEAAQADKDSEKKAESESMMGGLMERMLETQERLIKAVTAPKKKTVKRDANNLISEIHE